MNWKLVSAGLLAGCLLAGCRPQARAPDSTQDDPPPGGIPRPTLVSTGPDSAQTPSRLNPTPAPLTAATPTLRAISPAPSPPAAPIFGIELINLTAPQGLELAREAGAHWLRRNALFWSAVEPGEGDAHWEAVAELEAELESASRQGAQVILIVRGSPAWAQSVPGYPCSPIRPEKLAAFAEFLQAAVARYSPPPYNVRYWELGNEPDVYWRSIHHQMPFGCWGDVDDPTFGGGYYAEMLKAVYPAIKAADPEARVLVGGLLLDCIPENPPEVPPGSGQVRDCTAARFLEGILENGGGDSFDGVSFHAYDYYGAPGRYANLNWQSAWDASGPVLIAKARYLRNLLAAYGQPGKFLINSELALLCGDTGKEPACLSADFTHTKSAYLAQANAAALAEGLHANIWFSLRGWRGSQLVNQNMQPLPAYQAFQASARFLDRAAYLGEISPTPGVRGYEFVREGSRLWVIWSRDGQPQAVQLPRPPDAAYGLYGEPLPLDPALTISLAPVYLQWSR